ncbi:MAG: hypothetical protein ACRDYA_04220 [Egibacteraceae bacterium]
MDLNPASVTSLGHGYYDVAATVEEGELRTACPCHQATVRIRMAEVEILGEVTVRCPRSGALWEVRYDPWTPHRRSVALWIE